MRWILLKSTVLSIVLVCGIFYTAILLRDNVYIKTTVDGTIISAKQFTDTITIPVSTGKITVNVSNTTYNCVYEVEIDETVIIGSSGRLCKYSGGELIKLDVLHDKDTDKFVGYSIQE